MVLAKIPNECKSSLGYLNEECLIFKMVRRNGYLSRYNCIVNLSYNQPETINFLSVDTYVQLLLTSYLMILVGLQS